MIMARAKQSRRPGRASVVANLTKSPLKWSDYAFTLLVSFIDPCCPATEQGFMSRSAAIAAWRVQAKAMDNKGGEWMVRLFEHPKTFAPTRRNWRRPPDNFIYDAEFPKSKTIRSHDYMQPRLS